MTTRTLLTAVVAVALLSGGVAWSQAGDEVQRDARPSPTTATRASHEVPFTRLRSGHCFDAAALARAQDRVTVIPCSTPHMHEAFAVVRLAAARGAPYPGDAAVRRQIRIACEQALTDVRHTSLRDTSDGLFPVMPIDHAAWKEGNRRVVCALFPVSMRPRVGHLPAREGRFA